MNDVYDEYYATIKASLASGRPVKCPSCNRYTYKLLTRDPILPLVCEACDAIVEALR